MKSLKLHFRKLFSFQNSTLLSVFLLLPLFWVGISNTSCVHRHERYQNSKAKNAIFFIADGLDSTVIALASVWREAEGGTLFLESLPYSGLVKTQSLDNWVTDSAAAATAYASGLKANNRALGGKYDNNKWIQFKTITEEAKAKGLSLGMITTARATHATPAAFYASIPNRDQELEIAQMLLEKEKLFDVYLAGGRKYFYPTEWQDPEDQAKGMRIDGLNLVEKFQSKGWKFVQSHDEFKKLDPKSQEKVLGLFSSDHMSYEFKRAEDKWGEPSLAEMVNLAVQKLSHNPKGYLLIVEAARIDHAGHANIAEHVIGDTLALDEAMKLAVEQTQEDTLIIMTSDHGTGGLTFNGYPLKTDFKSEDLLGNIRKYVKSGEPNASIITWSSGPGSKSNLLVPPGAVEYLHKALIPTEKGLHTGIQVPIYAVGPGAANFTGTMDNTEVPQKIKNILNIE